MSCTTLELFNVQKIYSIIPRNKLNNSQIII